MEHFIWLVCLHQPTKITLLPCFTFIPKTGVKLKKLRQEQEKKQEQNRDKTKNIKKEKKTMKKTKTKKR